MTNSSFTPSSRFKNKKTKKTKTKTKPWHNTRSHQNRLSIPVTDIFLLLFDPIYMVLTRTEMSNVLQSIGHNTNTCCTEKENTKYKTVGNYFPEYLFSLTNGSKNRSIYIIFLCTYKVWWQNKLFLISNVRSLLEPVCTCIYPNKPIPQ